MRKRLTTAAAAPLVACSYGSLPVASQAPANADQAISLDADDIGGVVTSSKGPEAGVWVIAETKDPATGFRKIVVTDDRGRYVVPDPTRSRSERPIAVHQTLGLTITT